MLPKINYSESFARSNNPVFVFSSLLTQHQFGVENFAIGPLNRPDFLNNFQSQVTVDQPIYDAGQTRNAVKSAELAQKMTGEEQRLVQMNVISQAARAYYGAVLAVENLKAAEQAVRSAEADLKRAEAVRAAGMSTDVDVLSIRVHLAAVTEQRIDRAADVDVAKAALNDALGLPLDTPHTLTTPLAALVLPDLALDGLESAASTGRPEARQTHLATSLAQTQADGARSAMLPQVSFRGAFEADRQRFVDRGGANWLAAVSLRWNLFNGSADKARIAETGHLVKRAEFDEQRTDSAIRLQVRRAYAGLKAAQQRIDVATGGRCASRGEPADHAEPLRSRDEQRDRPVAHGNRGAGKPYKIPGRNPRSADCRHHARTCRGTSQRGFGGSQLNEALFPFSAHPRSSADVLRK